MRISSFCLWAVAGMMLFACNPTPEPEPDPIPEPDTEFAVEIKEVGADYVELSVSAPSKVEMAYMVSELPQALSPVVLFAKGTTVSVSHGDVIRITDGIVQETSYNFYAAAKLDAQNYSKVIKLEFTTEKYQFEDLINGRNCFVSEKDGLYNVYYMEEYVGVCNVEKNNLTIKAYVKN